MYKIGIVAEHDVAAHRVRVRFGAEDDLLSPWLEVIVPSTAEDVVECLPAKGNAVAVLLDESASAGCVIGAVHSKANPPVIRSATVWGVTFRDGAVLEYDIEAHALRFTPPSGGTIELAGSAKHVALAENVKSELDALKSQLQSIASGVASHTHPFVGVAPTLPGVTSPPAAPPYTATYEPGGVASAQVLSE